MAPKARVQKRLYYKIGEACKALDIQPYVLRYWETEFPVLQPRKSKAGQRVYSEEELQLIQRIKQLLYEEGYTIAGAKKKLESELASGGPAVVAEAGVASAAGGSATRGAGAAPPRASVAAARTASASGEADDDVDGVDASAADSGGVLDSAAGEQVERLRTGLQEALTEAREILRLLSA